MTDAFCFPPAFADENDFAARTDNYLVYRADDTFQVVFSVDDGVAGVDGSCFVDGHVNAPDGCFCLMIIRGNLASVKNRTWCLPYFDFLSQYGISINYPHVGRDTDPAPGCTVDI